MWNRHRESKNTKFYEIGSGTKLYYLFEFKGFSTWGESDTIFLCWLLQLSTQTTHGARSAQSHLASPSSKSQHSSSEARTKLSRSDAVTQLTAFSQIPQILRACFRCMTSCISPGHIFYLGCLFWHLWMTHSPRARVNTCAHVAPN